MKAFDLQIFFPPISSFNAFASYMNQVSKEPLMRLAAIFEAEWIFARLRHGVLPNIIHLWLAAISYSITSESKRCKEICGSPNLNIRSRPLTSYTEPPTS